MQVMIVAKDQASADELLAASQPKVIKEWKMADFAGFEKIAHKPDEATVMRGMTAFVKARPGTPVSFDVLTHEIKGLGLNLELEKKRS